MKPINKSKRQLAQLLIEAGVKQFPEGANWAAQDDDSEVDFYEDKPTRVQGDNWYGVYDYKNRVVLCNKITNWHQTVLSRTEFDQIVAESAEPQYCESVTRTIPEPVTAPTLDQLLQDYRNAADFAARKQAEADEAAKMRDERWKAVQARACELGVHISVGANVRESEPVITDWRDLRVGDVVMVTGCNQNPGWNRLAGVELDVVETGDSPDDLYFKPKGGERWCCSDNTRWCFIRRP